MNGMESLPPSWTLITCQADLNVGKGATQHTGWGESRFPLWAHRTGDYKELLISYCVISHGNDCKPTFAPACVFADIHVNVLSYKCAQNNSMCPLCMLHGCLSRSPLSIWSWKIKEQVAISLGKTLRPQEYPALEEDSIDLLHWSHLLCHA